MIIYFINQKIVFSSIQYEINMMESQWKRLNKHENDEEKKTKRINRLVRKRRIDLIK